MGSPVKIARDSVSQGPHIVTQGRLPDLVHIPRLVASSHQRFGLATSALFKMVERGEMFWMDGGAIPLKT